MDPETFAAQFDVSRETLTRLMAYQALLGRWQQRINLVGPATLDDFWARHVADSAQLLALSGDRRIWLDLGSGGGFPGLVVAIMLAKSGGHVHLVESDGARRRSYARLSARWACRQACTIGALKSWRWPGRLFWPMCRSSARVPWHLCRIYWSWSRRFSIHPQLLCCIRAPAGKMN